MAQVKYLVLLAATVASAQVRLRYLDFGLQPTPCCMVTDADGNAYVAGSYVTGTTPALTAKIVVYKLNPANGTVYRTIFGGSALDTPKGIAVDAHGNVFVAGSTTSPDFPLVTPLITNGPLGSATQGFLSKLDVAGDPVFSTFIGGSQPNVTTAINAITLDTAGNVYATGSTGAADFPVTSGANNNTGGAFVTKIANSGSTILFSTFVGSNGAGLAIAVDEQGVATVGGLAYECGFPATESAFQTTCHSGTYAVGGSPFHEPTITSYAASFVLRLSADGSHLIWSTYLGGTGNGQFGAQDALHALVLTAGGGVVVAGTAQSPDFPVTPGAFQPNLRAQLSVNGAAANLFITRFNSSGTAVEFSTFLGGSAVEQFGGLRLDAQEHPWVAGTTISFDFPLLPHSLNLGAEFLVQMASDGSSLLSSRTLPYGSAGVAVALGPAGSETVLGSAGSFIRIPAGGLSRTSLVAQMNAQAYTSSDRIAPGEAVTLFGTGLGPFQGVSVQPDSTGRYPTEVDGVQVTCDGIPAPLLYVSTHQIHAVIPFEVSGKRSTLLRVTYGSKTTMPVKLTIVPAYPVIFSVPASAPLFPLRNPVVWNGDGSVNSVSNPAWPGSKITFWVNGAGLFTPALGDGIIVRSSTSQPDLPVSVLFRGQPITATYGAAPGQLAGVLQVTATVPPLEVGGGFMQVQIGAFLADSVFVATGTR